MNTRTTALLGINAMNKLAASTVFIAGLGGVGGYVFEGLARSGVGHLILCDCDRVSSSNRNRQIIATAETVGRRKTELCAERAEAIDPNIRVETVELFLTPENIPELLMRLRPDYIADAIDCVSAKLALVEAAARLSIPIISSMGTAGKLDPTRLRVTDIQKTSTCPLARVMRRELRTRGIPHLDVVFSDEPAIPPKTETDPAEKCPASAIFVPASAGLLAASYIVKKLTE